MACKYVISQEDDPVNERKVIFQEVKVFYLSSTTFNTSLFYMNAKYTLFTSVYMILNLTCKDVI